MRAKLLIILAGIGAAIILWTWRSADAQEPPDDLNSKNAKAEVYSDGRLAKSGDLLKDSPAVVKIRALMRARAGKWKTNWVSFAPSVLIRSDALKIVLTTGHIIVNYKDNEGHPIQLVSELSKGDLAEVQSLVTEEIQGIQSPSSAPFP